MPRRTGVVAHAPHGRALEAKAMWADDGGPRPVGAPPRSGVGDLTPAANRALRPNLELRREQGGRLPL